MSIGTNVNERQFRRVLRLFPFSPLLLFPVSGREETPRNHFFATLFEINEPMNRWYLFSCFLLLWNICVYIQFVSNDIRNLIFLELYIKLKIANANYLKTGGVRRCKEILAWRITHARHLSSIFRTSIVKYQKRVRTNSFRLDLSWIKFKGRGWDCIKCTSVRFE